MLFLDSISRERTSGCGIFTTGRTEMAAHFGWGGTNHANHLEQHFGADAKVCAPPEQFTQVIGVDYTLVGRDGHLYHAYRKGQ